MKKSNSIRSIIDLVDRKIISVEQAREILFSSEDDRDKKSLKSEIKFLRELVEKLSKRSEIVKVVGGIEGPCYPRSLWCSPYVTWAKVDNNDSITSNLVDNNDPITLTF